MSENTDLDWTRFTRRIIINASVERLYQAWTVAEQIETWFLERADFKDALGNDRPKQESIQKGDTYGWKWHGWDHVAEGQVRSANGSDQISFSFGNAGEVRVSLIPLEQGTEVQLVQSDIPDDDQGKRNYYTGCSLGWSFWMVNLKAWIEHGIQLNETGIPFNQLTVFEYVNG